MIVEDFLLAACRELLARPVGFFSPDAGKQRVAAFTVIEQYEERQRRDKMLGIIIGPTMVLGGIFRAMSLIRRRA